MDHSFEENKGVSLVEFLVTVCVIIFILAVLFVFVINPGLNHVRDASDRVTCVTKLKGLGTAITVYSNDYEGRYLELPGEGPWSKELGFAYDLENPDFKGEQHEVGRTITASWYLLVREADVSPKSFICPSSDEKEFNGQNPGNLDIVQLWDFGNEPYKHVSYVVQNPYGKYPADNKFDKNFAVASDMNPWMKTGDYVSTPDEYNRPQIIKAGDETTYTYGNSLNHPKMYQEGILIGRYIKGTATGQNVLFADGHTEYKEQPNCGVNDDNIYTYWSTDENPTEQDIQGGTAPTARDNENDAQSQEDSFLVL